MLHLASEPAGVRVIADHQCPLRHASFVLSSSRKRQHALAIDSAKKPETRQQRIEKALATLRDQA